MAVHIWAIHQHNICLSFLLSRSHGRCSTSLYVHFGHFLEVRVKLIHWDLRELVHFGDHWIWTFWCGLQKVSFFFVPSSFHGISRLHQHPAPSARLDQLCIRKPDASKTNKTTWTNHTQIGLLKSLNYKLEPHNQNRACVEESCHMAGDVWFAGYHPAVQLFFQSLLWKYSVRSSDTRVWRLDFQSMKLTVKQL